MLLSNPILLFVWTIKDCYCYFELDIIIIYHRLLFFAEDEAKDNVACILLHNRKIINYVNNVMNE